MDNKKIYERIKRLLTENKYLSTPKNNKLVFEFLQAKFNGGYGRLLFDKRINNERTAIKKVMNLKRIDSYFKKDFDSLTEDEVLKFRDDLNNDKVIAYQTKVKWKVQKNTSAKVPEVVFKRTKRALSFRSKQDLKINLIEFYRFLQEYYHSEHNIELPDIMRFFRLVKPTDFQDTVVKFIPDNEVVVLLNNIRNRDFKAMVQLSLMSGARPCEILAVKVGQGNNIYKNREGKWTVHLPRVKGVSYKKFPFIVDMYEDELVPYFENLRLKEGDLLFKMTPATFRKLMHHYTTRYLGKSYSPKILRKTATMMRVNAGYTEAWQKKLLGHSPDSKVISHYVNFEGLKNEDEANEKLKTMQYPSIKQDYEKLKLQSKAQEERIKELTTKAEEIAELREAVENFKRLYTENIRSKEEARTVLNKK